MRDEGISLSAPVIMELIEAVHEKGASFRFQAKGYSMTPSIRNGDVITVSPLRNIVPRRGDVVAFRHPERPQMLVHRVLHTQIKKYFIKGDNCPEADGWIVAENILGVITKVERQGKARFWPNRSAFSLDEWVFAPLSPLAAGAPGAGQGLAPTALPGRAGKMKKKSAVATSLAEFALWDRLGEKRVPFSFDLEITARCNNDCRHCYINLPAGDRDAQDKRN